MFALPRLAVLNWTPIGRSRLWVSTLRGLVQNRLSSSSERSLGSRSSTIAAIASYPPKRVYREAGLSVVGSSPYPCASNPIFGCLAAGAATRFEATQKDITPSRACHQGERTDPR